MSNLFLKLLEEKAVLLADGATGTNLFAMGLQSGDPPELWNVDFPDRIAQHYKSFINAGSDIILTNTFGGNTYRMMLHKSEHRVAELNKAAVKVAKQVIADSGREVIIAGSIGPTGEILEPIGALTQQQAVDAFAVQCNALAEAGADVLWIETMSSKEEIEAAVQAAKQTGLPCVYTVSIDTNGRTMMGLGAQDIMQLHEQLQPTASGTNCGVGASEVVAAILNFKAMAKTDTDLILVAKANCGIPEFVNDKIEYNGTPELMAKYAVMARDAGAKIIGGCCGTSPIHIKAMREALDTTQAGPAPELNEVIEVLGEITEGALAQSRGEHEVQAKPRTRRGRR